MNKYPSKVEMLRAPHAFSRDDQIHQMETPERARISLKSALNPEVADDPRR